MARARIGKMILAACCAAALLAPTAGAFDFPFKRGGDGGGGDGTDVVNLIKKGVETKKKLDEADATRMSPEQEYYLGRSVSANILVNYRPLNNPAVNRYLNLLGQTLALASDRPETFKGYRFMLLDSDEINGFAAPGGFIFVTRGLVKCCDTEDGLAAVLAHEISHVQYKHGLRSIRTKRLVPVFAELLGGLAKDYGGDMLDKLVTAFDGCIDDVVGTLVNSKYSRETEVVADQTAVTIARRAGYDPGKYVEVLENMGKVFGSNNGGFGKSHPAPAYRIDVVRKAMGEIRPPAPAPEARARRFTAALAGL